MDLGNFVQAGIQWFGNELQNRRQADAAEAANAFSAQQYATRYQTTVADMRAAGINPMLAYGSGPGNAPSGVQAQTTNSAAGVNESLNQSKVTAAQVKLMDAQAEAASAQAIKTLAETPEGALGQSLIELQGSTAASNRANVDQINANVRKIEAEIPLIKQNGLNAVDQGKVLRQTVQMLADQAALYAEKGLTEHSIRKHISAQIEKLKADTALVNFDVEAASDFQNFGREYKQYAPIVDLLLRALRR